MIPGENDQSKENDGRFSFCSDKIFPKPEKIVYNFPPIG